MYLPVYVCFISTSVHIMYIYLYPGSAKDQREKCAHISEGSTGHACMHRSPDRFHC